MSLLSDPDFLIHSLRLNYLRNVDDPYASRIISLDPSSHSNPYVVAAGLSDAERWPELNAPSSVPPSDDESGGKQAGRSLGFPGATGLKYTTTIMGSRTGGMGLRVTGKRVSTSARASVRNSLRMDQKVETLSIKDNSIIIDKIPPTPTTSSPQKPENLLRTLSDPPAPTHNLQVSVVPPSSSVSTPNSPTNATQPRPADGALPNRPIPFIPKFKGAAEMEARRRIRMQNRIPPGGGPNLVPFKPSLPSTSQNLNPEISSSESDSDSDGVEDEEDVEIDDDEEDDFDDVVDVDDSLDADEFDPEFAASRGTAIGIDSNSDGISLLSGSGSMMSGSNFSLVGGSSLPQASTSVRNGRRLSPVREGRLSEERSDIMTEKSKLSRRHSQDPGLGGVYFEMVTPAPNSVQPQQAQGTKQVPVAGGTTSSQSQQASAPSKQSSPSSSSMFSRRPVPPRQTQKSALTSMLASTSSSTNPFSELYSAISARSSSESLTVSVFFPFADAPNRQKPMQLSVRRDATFEELLGFALWSFWEEKWEPRLDKGLEDVCDKEETGDEGVEEREKRERWRIKCSAVGYVVKSVEDDGEVDEDFPAPDRSAKLTKFDFDSYAVLEATPLQVLQNRDLESKIQRRPSRIVVKKKKSTLLLNAVTSTNPESLQLASSTALASTLATSVGMFPSSFGPSSSQGPPQYLRVRIADMVDAGHVSTTIQASSGMYMEEVLKAVCLKRSFTGPDDYALVVEVNGTKYNIPLDRTVKSLQGKKDLMLIKKAMLQAHGVESQQKFGKTTDPNASIFKRNSEVPDPMLPSAFSLTNAYKRYTVYRKLPMLVTRSARLLAIDGGYIHIMPLANKAKNMFDNGKTSSYDIKSIVNCQQSNKNSSTFKLVVLRDAEHNKRYEFEAENPKIANEIVTTIRNLKNPLDRSGTTKQSRRSRQVT